MGCPTVRPHCRAPHSVALDRASISRKSGIIQIFHTHLKYIRLICGVLMIDVLLLFIGTE